MHSTRIFRTFWAVSLLGIAAPAVAGAPEEEAAGHYRKGKIHYDLSEYRPALDEFKEAYRIKQDPVLLFNMGQCHRLLGEPGDAVTFYRRYLQALPNAPNRAEVERRIRELEEDPATSASTKERSQAPDLTSSAAAPSTESSGSKPVYKRWWFWASIGAAALLTTVVIASSGRRGNECFGVSDCYGVR